MNDTTDFTGFDIVFGSQFITDLSQNYSEYVKTNINNIKHAKQVKNILNINKYIYLISINDFKIS